MVWFGLVMRWFNFFFFKEGKRRNESWLVLGKERVFFFGGIVWGKNGGIGGDGANKLAI